MREAEVWKFVDGDDITAVRPTARFIADNALSLVAAAVEGWVSLISRNHSSRITLLQERWSPS